MVADGMRQATATGGEGSIEALITELGSQRSAEREEAREKLVSIGRPAAARLVRLLQDPSHRLRWEAAKALCEMRDPWAASALVDTLEDSESSVRWLAARGLIAIGRPALVPLLEGLERRSDSLWLREGARHILHVLVRDGVADEAKPVLEALEHIEPAVEAPAAAYRAVVELKSKL